MVKVAILFGGCSEEHDISVKSAAEIAQEINTEKYKPVYIGITKSGIWKMCKKPYPQWDNQNCHPAIFDPNKQGLIIFQNSEAQFTSIDVVFPVIHGKTGEDGKIQGLLELSGIPYVGCDSQSSVICMDKSLTYMVVKGSGISVPDFKIVYPGENPRVSTYPVYVKPARSGSSFGVSKVSDSDELESAIETARRYDNKILIEQAVCGIEVGCAIMGSGSEITIGDVDQITLSHGIFRIHQETNPEEGSENASFMVPADIHPDKRLEVQKTAAAIYKALGCRGLARVDMFLCENGKIILNEVNTMPGFTSYSRYPRMMAAAGITLSQIIDRLIGLALKG